MSPGVRPTSPLSPASSQLRKQALKDFGYLTGRMVQHLGPVDLTNILVCPGVSATLLPLLALGPSDVVEHLKTMLGAAFPEQGGVRVPCLALCAVVLMVPGSVLHAACRREWWWFGGCLAFHVCRGAVWACDPHVWVGGCVSVRNLSQQRWGKSYIWLWFTSFCVICRHVLCAGCGA